MLAVSCLGCDSVSEWVVLLVMPISLRLLLLPSMDGVMFTKENLSMLLGIGYLAGVPGVLEQKCIQLFYSFENRCCK